MKMKFLTLCGVLLAGLWFVSPSWGENICVRLGGGDWNDPMRWHSNRVPGNGDIAQISDDSITGFSGTHTNLTIEMIDGSLITSGDTVLSGSSLDLRGGHFNSSLQILLCNDGRIRVYERHALFSANQVQNNGTFHVEVRVTVNVSDSFIVGDASKNGTYIQGSNSGVVNVGSLSIGSDISRISFLQCYGTVLTSKDESGILSGGITISETGTANLSQGIVAVDVWGIQFANSNTDYTLIENGVSTLPANISSNVYDMSISGNSLVASLKTDLTSTGTFGAVKPEEGAESLTLYTNLEGEAFDNFVNWLGTGNRTLNIQGGTDPSSILLSLTGMGDMDSLIWDLAYLYPTAMLSTSPFPPQPSVPEPATWLLLLFGTVLLLKRTAR